MGARRATWATWASCAAALALCARAALLPLDTERLRASVGGYAVMNCHLDFPFGNEIPYHLQWDKDGEPVFAWVSGDGEPRVAARWAGRVRRARGPALGGGALNMSAVRETDAGLYRCRVTFPNRTPPARNNGTFYYLDVDGGNLIVTPPTNVTVLEGERAELECLPRSPEWDVRWARAGSPLQALPNGSLVLRRAAPEDLGEYECRVGAPDGRRQSATAFLDVQYKAKVVYSPKELYFSYGKPASLDCHFSANPPLSNLRWEKDGFLFDPYNVPGVFYSRNGSLLFSRVDESHEGVYSCTPYNALGSQGASRGVRVRVQRPPALVARPPPLLLARLGATVRLPCRAAAAPSASPPASPPAVRWAKEDGSPLPEGRHSLDGGNLTISSVAEEDRGVYVCTVTNEADELAVQSELLIENVPPRAPHNLTARAAPRSIHLSWVPGHLGAEVEYAVWVRARGAGEWRSMKLLTRGAADATLLALRPGTEYELRVLAQDAIGDGLFSKPLFVRTLDPEFGEYDEATAATVAVTDVAAGDWAESHGAESGGAEAVGAESVGAETGGAAGDGTEPDELPVSVRLLEEGALVRWRRGGRGGDGAARCSLRWYDAALPERRLLAARTTELDYALVSEVEEGASYWVHVECGAERGSAAVRVPEYARLRGVALGSGAAALLLAALGAALCVARRRLRDKRVR